MPSFAVRIDTPSLEMSASGAIWGGVWVELDGRPFPEAGWNDMSVAFIAAFLEVVLTLPAADPRDVHFMDGPFGLSVRHEGEGKVSIMATEVGGGGPSTLADKTPCWPTSKALPKPSWLPAPSEAGRPTPTSSTSRPSPASTDGFPGRLAALRLNSSRPLLL